jgi:hypothetical protein
LLKITRDTLRYKLKKYAIKAEEMGLSGEWTAIGERDLTE